MEEKFDITKLFAKKQVLDKGHVELIDGMVTQPMLKVVNSARVSFLKEAKELSDKDQKLIKFLIDHEHFSTLRHSYFSFRIKAPLCVFRQWWKYQIGSQWLENENVGSIEIHDTSWNEACLASDTLIFAEKNYGKKREIEKISIEKLNHYWTNGKREKVSSLKVRSLNEKTGKIEINSIKDVIERGTQDVYQVTLESGKKIKCTKSHRILTKEGWKTMGESLKLINNCDFLSFHPDKWMTDPMFFLSDKHQPTTTLGKNKKSKITNLNFEKVVSVTYMGKITCYDLEMQGENKNFVANGIIVHNSGRYVEFESEFYIPETIRIQSKDNKQGSHGKLEKLNNEVDPVVFFQNCCMDQYENYKLLVESGAAKEQARMLLPQNIYSECIWTCSLQTILFFLHQRLKEDAQWEIREYAKGILQLVEPMLIPGIVK